MKIQVNKQNVGLRIKQIRLDKGYTLEEFGKLFNTGKSNTRFWEQGRSLPNKERLKGIAKLGDMTVNELLYGSVEEFIKQNYHLIVNASLDGKEDTSSIINKYPAGNFIEYFTSLDAFTENNNVNLVDSIDSLFDTLIEIFKGYIKIQNNKSKIRNGFFELSQLLLSNEKFFQSDDTLSEDAKKIINNAMEKVMLEYVNSGINLNTSSVEQNEVIKLNILQSSLTEIIEKTLIEIKNIEKTKE